MASSESKTFSNDEDEMLDVGERLFSILNNIQSNGSFITGENKKTVVNPGLCIPSLGTIGLPVSPDNIRAMIQLCNLSPYGKGTETLVNESVRKSWQLDSNQFSFKNPDWDLQVAMFVDRAVSGLGLQAKSVEVKAEPYKLLIYEEGAFFLPHQDSEKADGMFGTLVMCLPSKHEGGEVIASHRDKRVKFSTAEVSEFGFSWAAWYADVTHEVKPVTSGHRIVLVYNLIHRPTASLLNRGDNKTKMLTDSLASWSAVAENLIKRRSNIYDKGWDMGFDASCPPALVYTFEHKYTTAELSFNRIKGVDQSRFAELQDACQQTGFDLFLVNIEKEHTGAVDEDDYYGGYGGSYNRGKTYDDFHTIMDDIDTTLKLVHVVDHLGFTVVKDLDFPEDMLLPADVLDRSPDDEGFQGFTGNEGASTSHFYRETGALIIPKKFAFSFELQQLKHGKGNFQKAVEKYKSIVSECPSDILAKQRLLGVCRLLPEGYRHGTDFSSFEEEQEMVMQIAFDYGDLKLFTRGMAMRHTEVLPSVTTLIAKAIVKHGFGEIRPSLDEIFRRKTDVCNYSFVSKISGLRRSLTLLSNLMRECDSICKQQSQKPSSEALEWQNGKVDHILSTQIGNSESDGCHLALTLNDLLAHVSLERIASFLETRLEYSAFVVSFISSLYEPVLLKRAPSVNDEMLSFCKRIFSKIAQSFKIEYTTAECPRWPSFNTASTRTTRLEPVKVTKLIFLAKLTDSNMTEIMDTLTAYAINAKTKKDMDDAFHNFLFPVGHDICQQIESTKKPPSIDEQHFITTLLSSYLTDYVKSRPPPPASDWKARTTLHCSIGCSYCGPVRRFLNDPNRQTQYFPMAEKWRKHVDSNLDKSYFKTEVIRNGSPHKLYIEKTQQAMAASNLHSWIERARTAQAQLNRLCRTSTLKELLGDKYQTILEHKNLQLPEDAPASQTLGTSTNGNIGRMARSTIPSKRPLGR